MQFYDNIPIEEYHAVDALSSSKLKTVAKKSLAHLLGFKDSRSKDFGQMVHDFLLLRELFDSTYLYSEEKAPARRGEGKKVYEKYLSEGGKPCKDSYEWQKAYFEWKNPGCIQISKEDMEKLEAIEKSINNNPVIKKIIEQAIKERSFYWTENVNGVDVDMKCRPDIFINNIILDIKTTDDASVEGFSRAIYRYNYDWQASFYSRGVEAVTGQSVKRNGWIAIENVAPYAVNLIYMPDEMSDDANEKVHSVIGKYANELGNKEEILKNPYGTEWKEAIVRGQK